MRLIHFLKRELAREIAEWVSDKIISKDQATQLYNKYALEENILSQKNYLNLILLTVAYTFIGIALIVLIGHNWENIPRGLRMGSLVILTLLINFWGVYQIKRGHFKKGSLAFFLVVFFMVVPLC